MVKIYPKKLQKEHFNTSLCDFSLILSSDLLIFSLCLSAPLFLSVFPFQFSSALISPPHPSLCDCSVSSQFWQTFLFIFFPHLLSYFWPHPPYPPTQSLQPPTPPPCFFSPFLLHLMLFLKSFGSSFTVACFFQCSEVMVEYSLPSERKREQFVPFAVNGDGCDQGCDLQTHRPAPIHTSTNTHKAMMMRPFPPSSPDPHLTTNEKHDNYPQLFAPQLSAVVILALI